MNEIQIFDNPEFGVIRTAGTSEQPLFCLADICRVLEIKNVSDCKSRLDQKGVVLTDTPTNGGTQHIVYINEKNLYKVIMRSYKPQAEPFQDWVCGDVLPTIRKIGSYELSIPSYQIENPIERAEKWIEEEKVRQQLQIENKKQKEQINVQNEQISEMSEAIIEMKSKTEYLDIILKSKGTVTVTQIAQDYGMSAKKFNVLLRNKGIQHKVNGQWILYGKYITEGYVHSKAIDITHKDGRKDVAYNTEWTQRGRLFLYETLKKDHIFPIIEQNK